MIHETTRDPASLSNFPCHPAFRRRPHPKGHAADHRLGLLLVGREARAHDSLRRNGGDRNRLRKSRAAGAGRPRARSNPRRAADHLQGNPPRPARTRRPPIDRADRHRRRRTGRRARSPHSRNPPGYPVRLQQLSQRLWVSCPNEFEGAQMKIIPLDRARNIGTFAPGIEIPLKPFFGSMGVAPPRERRQSA